jgi:hypothetical protein
MKVCLRLGASTSLVKTVHSLNWFTQGSFGIEDVGNS